MLASAATWHLPPDFGCTKSIAWASLEVRRQGLDYRELRQPFATAPIPFQMAAVLGNYALNKASFRLGTLRPVSSKYR